MKKISLLILTAAISIGAVAQKGKVTSAMALTDQGALDKAKEAIDLALENPKSKDWAKTYYALGKLAQATFSSENAKFKKIYSDPLVEAYNAYEKAIVLDPKGGISKTLSINNVYPTLGNDFISQAIERFQVQDYEGALKSFEYNMKVAKSDLYPGNVDTNVIYNAGLAAFNAKMYDKALEYLGICTTTKFEGTTPFLLMYQTYLNQEDSEKAERQLQITFEAFPEDQDVILQLVQFYLNNDKTDKAFEYILLAKEKDPTNFSLYWAEGVLQMQQEKYDEAIVALGKSIELKSDFFDTQYNMGVCYYNKGSEMNNKANEIMDNAKYRIAKAEADEVFKKGLPYMEAALKLKPDDLDTMKSLKEIYYRLQMTDKYNEMVKLIDGRD